MPIDFYQSAFCVLGIDDLKFKKCINKKSNPDWGLPSIIGLINGLIIWGLLRY